MTPEEERRFEAIEERLKADEDQTEKLMALFNMGRGIGKFLIVLAGFVTFVSGVYAALSAYPAHR